MTSGKPVLKEFICVPSAINVILIDAVHGSNVRIAGAAAG
jgi:hypothetical protein